MAFEFKLPDLGEGVQEGEIVRWLVEEGDTVAPEQHLVEVMTDKVTAELPAPVGGRVVQISGKPGEIVPVGHVLVIIEPIAAGNGAVDEAVGVGAIAEPSSAARTSSVEPASSARGFARTPAASAAAPLAASAPAPLAVPAVRRLAKELNVDLTLVPGSGPAGRVTEGDVRAAAGGAERPASAKSEPRRVALRGVRRAIAEHLLASHQGTAPYTYVEEIDFTELVSLRDRVQSLAERAGVRLTFLPLILAALSMALREHPNLNATTEPETGDLLVHAEQHISLAVHTDDGLAVPVIRNVENRNLLDLAREIERLSGLARAGSLTRDDVSGGTFSVTSLGPLGGLFGTPMLHTPQVAIMGIHKITPRAVVRDGVVVPREMGNMSLTLDHRYIDGHVGALFARTLKQYLEDPALMLFWLAELKQ